MSIDGLHFRYLSTLLRHELFREVTEWRMLRLREELVVRDLERFVGGAGEKLFEVVFYDHGRSIADLGLDHTASCNLHLCHLILLILLKILYDTNLLFNLK